MLENIFSFDRIIFNFINGFACRWPALDFIGIFFAKYCEWILLAILVVFLLKKFWKRLPVVFLSLFSAVVSRFFITNIIRHIWYRARPYVENNVNLLISHEDSGSFPSGHASFYFALSTIIYLRNKRLGIFFFLSSFIICLARVYSGVHWPLDILAGMIVGIITALFIRWVFKKLKNIFL